MTAAPPWLDSARLIERFAYPSYEALDAVLELASRERSSSSGRELWERCASRGMLSASWIDGQGPLFCAPCARCGAQGVMNTGDADPHRPDCPAARAPTTVAMAAAFAAERQLVTDAEPVAREWRRALEPWGAAPFESVCWTYEPHPPQLLNGWDGVCDLHDAALRPAVAAAIATRGSPSLLYAESNLGALAEDAETAWAQEIIAQIEAGARARKRPGKPRRTLDDEQRDLVAFALEGAALWRRAVEAGAKVTAYKPKGGARRRSPWAAMFPPAALVGRAFAALPDPWPPLLALLATGAQPVGSLRGTLALNLYPFTHREVAP